MKYEVRIDNVAIDDLYAIYRYVANNDSPAKADNLLDNIQKAMLSLETMPARGNHPPEMQRWGDIRFQGDIFSSHTALYMKSETKPFLFMLSLTAGAIAKTFYSNGSESAMSKAL